MITFEMGDIWVWGWGGVGEWVGVSGWEGDIFTRKSFVKKFLLDFTEKFPCKLIGDLQQQILQKKPLSNLSGVHGNFNMGIPFNFNMGSFYREFP